MPSTAEPTALAIFMFFLEVISRGGVRTLHLVHVFKGTAPPIAIPIATVWNIISPVWSLLSW